MASPTPPRKKRLPPSVPQRGGGADIRAVARGAGVSVSAVSRFLNGKKRLRPETEARITQVATELGYAPNRVARSLRLKRTQTIGLLLPDSSNPFFSDLVKGAEDATRSSGFALVLFNSNEDQQREADHLRTMLDLRCDGALVILAPDGADEETRRTRLQGLPIPMVFLDRLPGFAADSIVADNHHGGYEATRHLMHLGHRRIGVVSVDYQVSTHRDRLAGYGAALAQGRLRRFAEYVVRVPLTVQDGFSAVSSLLALREPPTALLATSNALAIGAVAAIGARGLVCPRDVSVVGYDSYDWQDVFAPRLSTVQQPAYLMGQRGAALLVDRLSQRNVGPPQAVVLRPTLVVRDSAQAPPR